MLARPCLLLTTVAALASCSGGDVVLGTRNTPTVTGRAAALPIGIANVNGSALRAASHRALLRFVPADTISIDRLFFGFKLRGADCWDPGLAGNGGGDGGVLRASLVEIEPRTGLPAAVIDEETVDACARHEQAWAEVETTPVLVWAELQATLAAGQMYGLVVRNAHAQPAENFFSFQMPIADTSLSGPQARNELNARASGGIMALDPREHVAWSLDDGVSFRYGSENGEYASFIAEDPAHPATRVPQYGFRLQSGETLAAQPYYAYKTDCRDCTVRYGSARYARTFTELGAFTATASDVGELSIRNMSSDAASSCTPTWGYGFRVCQLDEPVAVAVGEDYSLRASGTVELMRLDQAQRSQFPGVGTASDQLGAHQPTPSPGTDAKDVPSLWAGPLSAHFAAASEK